jgi:hypothetical protein
MKRKERLFLEQLEDRRLLATFGVPWPDAQHLTLSFVPDGTPVDGYRSTLFQTLDKRPTRDWQAVLLRAVQTWASQANIHVTVVPDGGEPLGTPGAVEGDPRFGDIRIAAHPLAGDACALATPFDPTAGTRAGDIVFNSSMHFTDKGGHRFDLFTVALHEFGHAFGLPDSTEDTSVMYEHYQGKMPGLSPEDVQAIQSLYGPPGAPVPLTSLDAVYSGTDAEAAGGAAHTNGTISTATALTGGTNHGQDFSINAAIADATAVSYYRIVVPAATSPQTLTASVTARDGSGLYPTLTVFDQAGQPVDANILTNSPGDYVVQVMNATPGATYFIEVSALPNTAGHDAGAYTMGVDFNVPADQLNTLASNTLSDTSSGHPQDVFRLKVSETQLMHLVLSAEAPGAAAAAGVRLQIFDKKGHLVLSLDALNGQTVSADVFLKEGAYTVSVVAVTADGSPLAPPTYLLRAKSLTDPLDPVPVDPTSPPPPDPTPTASPTPSPPPSSPWDPTTATTSAYYPTYPPPTTS